MLSKKELERLNALDVEIQKLIKGYGLNVGEQEFDIVSSEKMAEIIAYNAPVHYATWIGGRDYEKTKMLWRLGASNLPYEVYYSPNRAFLCDTDPLAIMILTIAHVYAHNVFGKNNVLLKTKRKNMTPFLARASRRFSKYEKKYGRDQVEKTVTAAIALTHNIDPYMKKRIPKEIIIEQRLCKEKKQHPDMTEEQLRKKLENQYPFEPERDILWFLIENSHKLRDWQRDILSVVREQGYHLYPITQTVIINEGWCAFWHEKIMKDLFRNKLISSEEYDTFSRYNSGILAESKLGLNHYLVGNEIWKYIEQEYGIEKMLQIGAGYDDSQFIYEFLTDELIHQLELYIYAIIQIENEFHLIPIEKNPKTIRDLLVKSKRFPITPVINVVNKNFHGNGSLGLCHRFDEEKTELDIEYAQKTMEHLYYLWGGPIYLATKEIIDEEAKIYENTLLSFSRKGFKQRNPNSHQLSLFSDENID